MCTLYCLHFAADEGRAPYRWPELWPLATTHYYVLSQLSLRLGSLRSARPSFLPACLLMSAAGVGHHFPAHCKPAQAVASPHVHVADDTDDHSMHAASRTSLRTRLTYTCAAHEHALDVCGAPCVCTAGTGPASSMRRGQHHLTGPSSRQAHQSLVALAVITPLMPQRHTNTHP